MNTPLLAIEKTSLTSNLIIESLLEMLKSVYSIDYTNVKFDITASEILIKINTCQFNPASLYFIGQITAYRKMGGINEIHSDLKPIIDKLLEDMLEHINSNL